MLDSLFIVALFILLNIITMIKRVPIFGIALSLFTIFLSAVYILPDVTLPYNSALVLFCVIMAICNMFINVLELNQK
jgi:hypothetical protein